MLFMRETELFAIARIVVRPQLHIARPKNKIDIVVGLHEYGNTHCIGNEQDNGKSSALADWH
jgi:hypothetical protein